MTIEEINQLLQDEDSGTLRKPKNAENKTEKELLRAREIMTVFVQQIIENPYRDTFLNSLIGQRFMQTAGITRFADIKPSVGMYSVKTVFGKGVFFDAHRMYPDGKYPPYVQRGYCFGNTYAYAILNNIDCDVVSGIAYLQKPFLHSIIVTKGNQVIDFNYNIVMDKDLYFNLLNFETLAEVDSKTLKETYKLISENSKKLSKYNIQSPTINFAFDEVLNLAKQESGNEI